MMEDLVSEFSVEHLIANIFIGHGERFQKQKTCPKVPSQSGLKTIILFEGVVGI